MNDAADRWLSRIRINRFSTRAFKELDERMGRRHPLLV
jgi:hypothetical protein